MAGIQAGGAAARLSIELVAEIARLQQDLDRAKRLVGAASNDIARSARAANDNVAQGTMGVASSFDRLGRQAESLRAKLSPLAAAQQQFTRSMQEADRLYRAGAISLREYHQASELARQGFRQQVVAINDSNRALGGVNRVSGQTRAGMQQLSFQVNDVATMFAMGANPMQIFASQAGQVTQAIGLMSGGAKGFVGFLGGPWGIAIMSAVTVLGVLGASLLATNDNAEKAEKAVSDLSQQLDFAKMSAEQLKDANKLLADSNAEVERTSIAAANAARVLAEERLRTARATLKEAEAEYERIAAFTSDPMFAEGSVAYGGYLKKAGATPQRIAELRKSIDELGEQANRNRFNVELWTSALDESGLATERLRTRINELREAYQQSGDPKLLQQAIQLQGQITQIEENARKSGRKRKEALTEEQKALRDRNRETERFIETLNDEIERIGLNEKALRQLQVQKVLEVAVTKEQIDAINDANRRREAALAQQERQAKAQERLNRLIAARDATRELDRTVEALRREAEVMGMSGWVRERRLAQMQREAEIGPRLVAQALALAAGDKALSDELQRQIDLLNERYGLQIQMGNQVDRERQAHEVLRIYNDELRDTIYLLQYIGGMGDVLGGLLGLASGNIGGIRGSVGALLNTVTSTRKDEKTGEIIAIRLGDELRSIFGMNGQFGATLTAALHSAGLGMAAGNMAGARGTSGQIGSAAGGILGGIAGEAFKGALTKVATGAFGKAIGGAIGSAVPVVGTILGGLAGGLIGNLFGGGKSARAVVTGSGANVGGSNKDGYGASGDMGSAVFSSLKQIADQLGATIGSFQVAIGMRGDDIRVNTSGTSMKSSKGARSFGQDANAAIAAAINDAIRDGALQGLSRGANALLRRGGDIEAQLQKALAFEGVFKALEESVDPTAAALKQLEEEFTALKAIFAEAGASAEEYAKLEELRAMRRAELERQGGKANEETNRRRELEIELMQLQGDHMGALALARQQELAELPASLHVLQEQVWAAQLLNERRLLEIQLMEAQGNAAGALAAQRELELEATHESLRGLKEQIWALQDAQEAARAAEQLRDAWSSVGDGIMEEVRRIRGLTGSRDGTNFAALMGQFNAMTAAARSGDLEAAKSLPGLSQDLLRAAEMSATSRQELERVRAQAAASLEATNAAIGTLTDSDSALLAAAEAMQASSSATDNMAEAVSDTSRVLRDELAQLRREMKEGLAAVAGNTGRVAKKLDDVTSASGGDAIATVAA